MTMFYRKDACILLLILLLSCSSKSQNNSSSDSMKVEKSNIKSEKVVNSKDWHYFNISDSKIYIPITWNEYPQSKIFFFTEIDDSNKNTFFAVSRFDELANNLTLEDYINGGYNQLKNDSVELFKEYSVKKLIFDNRNSIYAEFVTEIQGDRYISFGMYFEINGKIYDLTLKVKEKEKEKYYYCFQNILYNYKINNDNIFSEHDELDSIKVIHW